MNFLCFRNISKRSEKVLKQETLEKYLFNVSLDNVDNKNVVLITKGKGWHLYYINGFRIRVSKKSTNIGHSGKVATYLSYFLFNKKTPFGVMMASNIYSDSKGTPYKLIRKLLTLIRQFSLDGNFGKLINFKEDEF